MLSHTLRVHNLNQQKISFVRNLRGTDLASGCVYLERVQVAKGAHGRVAHRLARRVDVPCTRAHQHAAYVGGIEQREFVGGAFKLWRLVARGQHADSAHAAGRRGRVGC